MSYTNNKEEIGNLSPSLWCAKVILLLLRLELMSSATEASAAPECTSLLVLAALAPAALVSVSLASTLRPVHGRNRGCGPQVF